MKYVSIDIETTGLNPHIHDIVEFGAVIDDLANPQPIEKLPTFQAILVQDHYRVTPYCMTLHQRLWSEIQERDENDHRFMAIDDLPTAFYNFLSKNGYPYNEKKEAYDLTVAGKNFASFDLLFLKEQCFWHGINFKHRTLDPAVLYLDPKIDTELPGMGLCLKRAGINEEVTHGAVPDALQVIKLIRHHFCR